MVDTEDLKSFASKKRAGSSPAPGTINAVSNHLSQRLCIANYANGKRPVVSRLLVHVRLYAISSVTRALRASAEISQNFSEG